jgi:hypothetical protein
MTTNDFLSYTGDFLVGYVQYGNSSGLCNDLVLPLVDSSSAVVFNTLVSGQMALGNVPIDYNTQTDSKLASTVIDVNYSGRSWTY